MSTNLCESYLAQIREAEELARLTRFPAMAAMMQRLADMYRVLAVTESGGRHRCEAEPGQEALPLGRTGTAGP